MTRLAAAALSGALLTLAVLWSLGYRPPVLSADGPPLHDADLEPLRAQLADLQARATAAEKARCVMITAPIVEVSVYDTPNLGRHPVAKAGP